MLKILKHFLLHLINIKNLFAIVSGAFWFAIENYRKRYPYVLLGEKKACASNSNNDTILLYRISGKRYLFECSATEICNSKDMISKFHPLDVRIISFIAGVEQVLKVKREDRIEKFENLKDYIFNK